MLTSRMRTHQQVAPLQLRGAPDFLRPALDELGFVSGHEFGRAEITDDWLTRIESMGGAELLARGGGPHRKELIEARGAGHDDPLGRHLVHVDGFTALPFVPDEDVVRLDVNQPLRRQIVPAEHRIHRRDAKSPCTLYEIRLA